jgi:CheY-specific phosphatase CheX
MSELNECQTTFVITPPVINTDNKDKIYSSGQQILLVDERPVSYKKTKGKIS